MRRNRIDYVPGNFTIRVNSPNIRRCMGVGGLKQPQAMKAIRGSRLLVSSMKADIFLVFLRFL